MRFPPAVILAGVARTLEEDVLPAVESRAARGLVFATLEVLANVQDLVEWRADVREEELASAAAALAEAATQLEAIGFAADAARVRDAVAAAARLADRDARGCALDAALEEVLVVADRARAAGDRRRPRRRARAPRQPDRARSHARATAALEPHLAGMTEDR